jgi:hypothetical protein
MGATMGTAIRALLRAAAAVAALAILCCGPSQAVEFKDIAGTWCTEAGRIQFDKTKMVIALSNGQHIERQITDYVFDPAQVVVKWMLETKATEIRYGEFTRTTMVQLAATNPDGRTLARRAFHRC